MGDIYLFGAWYLPEILPAVVRALCMVAVLTSSCVLHAVTPPLARPTMHIAASCSAVPSRMHTSSPVLTQ